MLKECNETPFERTQIKVNEVVDERRIHKKIEITKRIREQKP